MNLPERHDLSRREFLRNCALGTAALACGSVLGCRTGGAGTHGATGPATRTIPLDRDWLFGGIFSPAATAPGFNDAGFSGITLPHCVTKLSWQEWDPASWEHGWIYRRHFTLPKECEGLRVFLQFDGVMIGTTPTVNGHALPQWLGGYLPSRYEITEWLRSGDNVLAVAVDSRWSNVPPEGSPKGAVSVDYMLPGGIHRSARLAAVPQVFISDVFARPVQVLDAARRVDVACSIDAAAPVAKPVRIRVELRNGARVISRAEQALRVEKRGTTGVMVALSNLGNVALWDVDAPQLYHVVTTLLVDGKPVHDYRVRIGFREARFELDGFFLNGRRLQLFGLNRHELFPYVGYAMPPRVMRRDAEIMRRELNCNSVRCSHYPQTEAFLDACDELGMVVWEEIPGWGYLGNEAWKELVKRDVKDMVVRDRNHPSIVIWGVRINESKNDPALYKQTKAIAKSLDSSRPTSGAMVGGLYSTKNWFQDVFAYNDYSHNRKTGKMRIKPPLPGVPYLLTEAVGQVVGIGPSLDHVYRRAGNPALQAKQAIYHAEAHDQAGGDKRYCGVIAWCAFEYTSPVKVAWNGVKYPGVVDLFRIPKLGASFYQAQVSPGIRPVIQPNFYWDFGPQTPRGPGKHAAIFSNCDRLELSINGKPFAALHPERKQFPNLKFPPFFADLDLDGAGRPELRIDGYAGGKLIQSRMFSSDPARDQFLLEADDARLVGDGSDATRVVFGRVDQYGAVRPFMGGEVSFKLSGPGVLVGDNPFRLADAGDIAAVWVRTQPGGKGRIRVTATHSALGTKSVEIHVARAAGA